LTQSIQTLIATLFSNWVSPKSLQDNLHIERVSGAMTNAVFFVTVGNKRMLLRVYGIGCEQILDRNKELDWLSRLSQLNMGPKLLGTFGNGRFEEYLPSTTLTRNDLRLYSKPIASRLHQLHSIVETFPPNTNETLEVWINIDKWYTSLVQDRILDILAQKNASWQDQISTQLDLQKLQQEIQQCKMILSKNKSPIVFAHNDVSVILPI
jgi:choline/ethanolamine kinase